LFGPNPRLLVLFRSVVVVEFNLWLCFFFRLQPATIERGFICEILRKADQVFRVHKNIYFKDRWAPTRLFCAYAPFLRLRAFFAPMRQCAMVQSKFIGALAIGAKNLKLTHCN